MFIKFKKLYIIFNELLCFLIIFINYSLSSISNSDNCEQRSCHCCEGELDISCVGAADHVDLITSVDGNSITVHHRLLVHTPRDVLARIVIRVRQDNSRAAHLHDES